mmetsp:Transcript_45477/g.90040  ORF Transcript_45477/g.90040 Transcript_45477/m.90040 type:complete len:344 (+) Transcript_45477:195-1226(+)|eukprot:CAMPEP_0172727692 /NCGR_PEP_ID=MMETSP1074-20121228/91819_1 /TAXON_ID=2916 /ORGANISM="Ceratium fusus, Strain PA161109" /LENGTH=343 /DNA_ID=CAMNT_0013554865 /DNA_START=190 /DNA_END=1221 /DNA_ORIENTATION=-
MKVSKFVASTLFLAVPSASFFSSKSKKWDKDKVLNVVRESFTDTAGTGVMISMEYCSEDACGPDEDPNGVPAVGGDASLFRVDQANLAKVPITWTESIVKPWGYLWFASSTQQVARQANACAYPVDANCLARVNSTGGLDRCGTIKSDGMDTPLWQAYPKFCCSEDCVPVDGTSSNVDTCYMDVMASTWAQLDDPNWIEENLFGPWVYTDIVLNRYQTRQLEYGENGEWPLPVPPPDTLVLAVCNHYDKMPQDFKEKYESDKLYREAFLSKAALMQRLDYVREYAAAIKNTGVVVLHQCPGEEIYEQSFLHYYDNMEKLIDKFDIPCYWESGLGYADSCPGKP